MAQDEESVILGPVPKTIAYLLCGLEQFTCRLIQLPVKSMGIFPESPVNAGSGP